MTFRQQLILMIVDKLVIAAIIAAAVYYAQRKLEKFRSEAQRKLEKFRSEQSLQNEIAKERVNSLASGWTALNNWDFAVTQLLAKFAGLLRMRLDLPDEAWVDELGLPDVDAIAEWLALQLKTNRPLIDEIKRDCEDVLGPLVEESMRCSTKAKAAMQENRFWFGKELYDHCKQFHTALHQVCLSFSSKEFEQLPVQLKKLNDQREDILTALQRVKSLS